MRYVYILSDYEESGAENVTATLDRSRLLEMAENNWPPPPPDGESWRIKKHEEWMASARDGLCRLLAKDDEELAASKNGHNTQHGWGGMMLHVVELK